ncbi:hypothetical protein D3C84_1227600 [compost metagenome]
MPALPSQRAMERFRRHGVDTGDMFAKAGKQAEYAQHAEHNEHVPFPKEAVL